jgi:hypothetical protein
MIFSSLIRLAASFQASVSLLNRPETSVITSKPAIHDQGKTGHTLKPSKTRLFYPAAS